MPQIIESAINLIAENTRIEGNLILDQVTRVHGTVVGRIHALPGSTLILSETALVEGDIEADTLMIDGFVQGNVVAGTRVVVSGTGRVIGDIRAPSVIEFGAHFEGNCTMNRNPGMPPVNATLAPTSAGI